MTHRCFDAPGAVPAQAGAHIPEASVYGSMGRSFHGAVGPTENISQLSDLREETCSKPGKNR